MKLNKDKTMLLPILVLVGMILFIGIFNNRSISTSGDSIQTNITTTISPPIKNIHSIAFIADAKPALGHDIKVLKGDFDQIVPQSPGIVDAIVAIGDMNPISDGNINTETARLISTVKNIPIFYVLGNHELGNKNDVTTVKTKFVSYNYSPNPGPDGSKDTTYSFDVDDIHVVVLNEYWDGNTNGKCDWYPPSGGIDTDDSCFKYSKADGGFIPDTLYNWLDNDLNNSTKKWKIVVGHEPLYPWGGHVGDSIDKDKINRDKLENMLVSKGVNAFISGHTHYSGVKTVDSVMHVNAGLIGDNVGNGDDFATITYVYIDSSGKFNLLQKYQNPTWDNVGSKLLTN